MPSDPTENLRKLPNPILQAISQVWDPRSWDNVHSVVALSGGADSVALLRALHEIQQQRAGKGRLYAVHVNHHLRGRDSEADARWCAEFCDSLGIVLEVLSSEVKAVAELQGDGIEAAARAERHRLLTQAAEKLGARYVVTAHTQDDQVETILFRILRGTGLRGLGGIPRFRPASPSVTLVRPLLECSRQMVVEYLEQLGQAYRTDQSNFDPRFARNRLRHQLLPELRKKYNPDIDTALLRLALQAADAQRIVEQNARQLLAQSHVKRSAHPPEIAIRFLEVEKTDSTVVCEALRILWREALLAEQGMTFDWWQRLTEFSLNGTDQESLTLPGNVQASKSSGTLILRW